MHTYEIDCTVAEEVMGYKRWRLPKESQAFLKPQDWKPESEYTEYGLKLLTAADKNMPLFQNMKIPSFSTSLEDAFSILYKFDFERLSLSKYKSMWRCCLGLNRSFARIDAETPPLAICLTALSLSGYDIRKWQK
jgi:hypothetical protein